MLASLLITLVFAVLLTGLYVVYSRLLGWLGLGRLTDTLRDAAQILETRKAPRRWALVAGRQIQDEGRLRARLVERMESFICFFSQAQIYQNAEARAAMLHELGQILEEWKTIPFSKVVL